jgi:hypothetical protein
MDSVKSALRAVLPTLLKIVVVLIPLGLIYLIYTILTIILPVPITLFVSKGYNSFKILDFGLYHSDKFTMDLQSCHIPGLDLDLEKKC